MPTDISWPEVITSAAQSPLGIAALAILAVSAVAVYLFRDAPPKPKLFAFAMLLAAVIGFAFTISRTKQSLEKRSELVSEVKTTSGAPIPEAPPNPHHDLFSTMPNTLRRLTEYDLTSLPPSTNTGSPSRILGKHTFTFKKDSATQNKFYHIASTSSDQEPNIKSDSHPISVSKMGTSSDGKLNEFLFVFDISKDPIGEEIDLRFTTDFVGAFDRPEQQWVGIRVPATTEMAVVRLRFSPEHPVQRVEYYVKEAKTEERIELNQETLRTTVDKSDGKGIKMVQWQIPRPKPDQRYCISWNW